MKKYTYEGYEILSDGTIISPFGRTLLWFDDKFIKINIDGKVKCRNGLNILYEAYYGVPVTRAYIVRYRNDKSKAKDKSNLILTPRSGSKRAHTNISVEDAEKIIEEYGLNNEERRLIKNGNAHPSISQRNLAKKYNVSVNTIQRILNGKYRGLPKAIAN